LKITTTYNLGIAKREKGEAQPDKDMSKNFQKEERYQ
jgi:hypothetical protein